MGNALKNLGIMWLCIVVVYIMLSFLYPVFTTLAAPEVETVLAAPSVSQIKPDILPDPKVPSIIPIALAFENIIELLPRLVSK